MYDPHFWAWASYKLENTMFLVLINSETEKRFCYSLLLLSFTLNLAYASLTFLEFQYKFYLKTNGLH